VFFTYSNNKTHASDQLFAEAETQYSKQRGIIYSGNMLHLPTEYAFKIIQQKVSTN
jgi:hypothetical protein